MKRNLWNIPLIVALASSLTAPLGAAAEPGSAPVRIDACGASKARPALTFVNIFGQNVSQAAVPAMLMIDFANGSANPISTVDFGVVSNGKLVAMVRDTGMFAQKARIMHAFEISENTVPTELMSTSCIPLRVQYADGTSWMNPNIPAH